MGLDSLRDNSTKGGVKELWGGEVSPEVKKAWEKAEEILKEREEKCLIQNLAG